MIVPYPEWELGAHPTHRGDPLWTVRAFRLAVYAIECHGADCAAMASGAGTPTLDQLTRAIGSVAANIAEGYSRSSLAERARFYGYALGSAREAIVWYDSARALFGAVTSDRQAILIQVRRLLLTTLRRLRPAGGTAALRDPRDPTGSRR